MSLTDPRTQDVSTAAPLAPRHEAASDTTTGRVPAAPALPGTVTSSSRPQLQCMEVWGGNRSVDSDFQMPGLHIWLHSRAHGESNHGGDVYYLSSCASGRITRMLLADVSGHGNSVSETATRLRDLMRQNINRINQSHLVARMNDRFSQVAERNGAFATAVVSTFFAPTRTLTMCLAGHPHPLVYRKKTGAWSVLNVSHERTSQLADLPLGVTGNVQYSEHNIRLEKGDCVLLYTDGLTEAANRSGQQLGTKQLCAIADELDPAQPGQFLPALLRQIERDAGYRFDSDDMTALLIEATDSTVSLKNNLLAPIRLLRSLFGSSDPANQMEGAASGSQGS